MKSKANGSQRGAATARAQAARIVARVRVERRYLDSALDEARRARPEADWALVQELCYGTLRWYHQLAGIAALFLNRPLAAKHADVHALLLVGLYQLRSLRVPDYAAVDATVAAAGVLGKRWAAGLVNACLRGSLRERERVERAVAASEELLYSHPAWLIDALRRDHPAAWRRVLEANNARPPMTLRVNAARLSRAEYQPRLAARGLPAHAHSRAPQALVLERPVSTDDLPGFGEGLVSVQDAAAQLAVELLDAQAGERVLDACAAPGGKTAHILERTPGLAELAALDVDPARLERLRANLARLRLGARVVLGDAGTPERWWDGRPYGRILVDAPCSATGVIRRHPDIKTRRQPEDLAKLARAQARILDGVWPCLAPGGKLLYTTCSVLAEENERQIRDFMRRRPDAISLPLAAADALGYQILPGEEEMDGFYYACLGKG